MCTIVHIKIAYNGRVSPIFQDQWHIFVFVVVKNAIDVDIKAIILFLRIFQ